MAIDPGRAIRAALVVAVVTLVAPPLVSLLFFVPLSAAVWASGAVTEATKGQDWQAMQQLRGHEWLMAWFFLKLCASVGYALGATPAALAGAGLGWRTYRVGSFRYDEAALYASIAVAIGQLQPLLRGWTTITAENFWVLPLILLGNCMLYAPPAVVATLVCRHLLHLMRVLERPSRAVPKS